jgi:hypothetical protein
MGPSGAWIAFVLSIVMPANATDVFYLNKDRVSPNGRFKIEAVSPKNRDPEHIKAFADEFVYTLTDTKSGAKLWSRKQGEDEGSCASLHIDDDGWVVITTGWNELLPVAPDGKVTGRIDILDEALTKDERRNFVADTTAGPMWAGYSEWYFNRHDQRRLFVIRPWWGRRIVIDLPKGALVEETPAMNAAFAAHETAKVLHDLEQAVIRRETWDKDESCEEVWPVLQASFLAGCLGVEAAVPYLEALQDSNYSGSSTSGGLGYGEDFSGRVNPHNYSTFTLRQVVRFALRRLGRVPKFLPCHEFEITADAKGKDRPYQPKAKAAPGAANLKMAHKGMSAEETLDLLGSPDWITYDGWEYDIDVDPPVTLRLKWDARKVADVDILKPAAWNRKLVRERCIAD